MERTAIVAALVLLAASVTTRADANDIKGVAGSVCQPTNETQAERLAYNLRGVRNRDRERRARVICPLLRDNFDGARFDDALQQVVVGARVPGGTVLVCKLVVRRFDQQTNQWTNDVVRTSIAGPFAGLFEFDPLPSYAVQIATIVVQCNLPPRAEIDSVFWSENSPTDEFPPE